MDISAFVKTLIEDLKLISEEKKLEFAQRKIKNIEDDVDRKTVENAISFYFEFGKIDIRRPKTLVLTVHGIRTEGVWQPDLENHLESYDAIECRHIKYGFKDIITFIIPWLFKIRHIDHVETQMQTAIKDSKPERVVLIAHSFGTYLSAKALERNSGIKLDRIIFCGAVAPEKFPWHKIDNFPRKGLVNDCGKSDFLPILAKIGTYGYGTSGVFGFHSTRAKDRQHKCGHSGFFTEEFYNKYWVPYICDGRIVLTKAPDDTRWFLNVVSLVPAWLGLAVLASATCFLIR